jgi:phosphonate transport system substrate-binding protein
MKGICIKLTILFLFLTFTSYAQQDKNILRIGIIKYKTEEKLMQTYLPMADYIGKKLNMKAILEIVDEEALGFELTKGTYDIGIFKPFPYLKSKVNFPELEVFASQSVKHEDHYVGAIVVKKSSGIKTLSDFKDKKFLFIKPTSTSGFRYPKGIFKEYDIDIEESFFNYGFSYDHAKAIDALVNDEVDGIAISKDALLNQKAFIKEDYVILEEYNVPNHAYVLSPKLDSLNQVEIKSIMLNAFKDPESKVLFSNPLNITKWIEKDDNYYNYLRRYLRIIRVKPSISTSLDLKSSASEQLRKQGDMISILQDGIYDELIATNRFSSNEEASTNNHIVRVTLSLIGEGLFHYQVYFNDIRVSKSNISAKDLISELPKLVTASALTHLSIKTKLLSNGNNWFVTYGTDDGLNYENYVFNLNKAGNIKIPLEVKSISELNTYFKPLNDLVEGQFVSLDYVNTEYSQDQITVLDNLDTDDFWADNFWDKLGLLGGASIAVSSAFLGWLLSKRKKRKFKLMLTDTNQLLKDYHDEQIEHEQKIIELKEAYSHELEKGNITENQFLILKHKIDDIENELSKLS